LKDRTTVLKRLKSLDAANRFIAGWLTYYNFFRANESASGKIPAEQAGISFRYRYWEDIVNNSLLL